MTLHHVVVIVAALALVGLCMVTASCTTNLPQVIGLSLAVIAGAWGHAQGNRTQPQKPVDPAKATKDAGDGR